MFRYLSRRRIAACVSTAAALTAACLVPDSAAAERLLDRALLLGTDRSTAIPGQYIVVLHDRASAAARPGVRSLAVTRGAHVLRDHSAAIQGFAATLPDQAVEALRNNWVTSHHTTGPAVATMSLGGGASSAVDTAVTNSINDGVTYAVAAGNADIDACTRSPARVPAALTVGATMSSDSRSSTRPGRPTGAPAWTCSRPAPASPPPRKPATPAPQPSAAPRRTSPHVAGVAALYLQGNSGASPATVGNVIRGTATAGVVTNAGTGSPNRLLASR